MGLLPRPPSAPRTHDSFAWCWSFSSFAERGRPLEIVNVACLDYPLDRTNKRAGGRISQPQNLKVVKRQDGTLHNSRRPVEFGRGTNLLDQAAGDYKINSTFQTASGTTNVEINKGKLNTKVLIAIVVGLLVLLLAVIALFLRP